MATVNFAVTNNYSQGVDLIDVECTALVDGEPVETNAGPVSGVGAGETAYGSVTFFKVNGRQNATASCRVAYIAVKL